MLSKQHRGKGAALTACIMLGYLVGTNLLQQC